ncbi:hypothetical protein [Sorangium sp. So ce406]|uniref:hypothetical protein n=1 Tax=Sorangium sp. So ce406 TaxID=3133311 RepID=UPI003F5BCB58
MNKPLNFALAVTFGLAVMQFPAHIARAADAATCGKYASGAVAQQNDNLKRGCNISGSAWTSDYNDHYNWCLNATVEQVVGGLMERAIALQSCNR